MSVWAGRASDQPESSVATNLEEILKGVFDFFLLEKGLDRLGRGGRGGGYGARRVLHRFLTDVKKVYRPIGLRSLHGMGPRRPKSFARL